MRLLLLSTLLAGCVTASDGSTRPFCYEMRGAGDIVVAPCESVSPPLQQYPAPWKRDSTQARAPGPGCKPLGPAAWTCEAPFIVEVVQP